MEIILNNITKKYSNTIALKNISLKIKKQKITAILGPSGCGKTTLLRIISGLIKQSSGDVLFNDKNMNDILPQRRKTAMVFQNYALFPHLNVFNNIAYGLKNKIKDSTVINKKVKDVLEIVQLGGLENRKVNELSGGQQQRVALARAIVIDPDILLFDEPLSNLDKKLREEMRKEIKRIHELKKVTTVYVTHDQREALALADEVIVMNKGIIKQIDEPDKLYRYPKNFFVADFLGFKNIFSINEFRNNFENKFIKAIEENEFKSALIRSEEINISDEGIGGVIKSSENLGSIIRYIVKIKGTEIVVDQLNRLDNKIYKKGEKVNINYSEKSFHFLE